MPSSRRRGAVRAADAAALVGLLDVVGCGPGGPPTYTVRGRGELAGGDVKVLAGHTIEAQLTSDNLVRADGAIQEDGSFWLQTLYKGVKLNGAQEGTYEVRFLFSDDDKQK